MQAIRKTNKAYINIYERIIKADKKYSKTNNMNLRKYNMILILSCYLIKILIRQYFFNKY